MRYPVNRINAVVLAGGINRISLFDGYTPGYKGLLPVGGKVLMQYTLDALQELPQIDRICIIGPIDEIRKKIHRADNYEFVPGKETLLDNILNGLRHFGNSPNVLLIPSDLPLVTPKAISDFLRACGRTEASQGENIFWAMVPEESFVGPYAEVRKGFNRFRDISVCHGNLFLASPSLTANRPFNERVNAVYGARKSSVKTAAAIGMLAGISYVIGVHLFRILTINQMARIVSRRLGAGLVPVVLEHPEVAIDVDEQRDYEFILKQLGETIR